MMHKTVVCGSLLFFSGVLGIISVCSSAADYYDHTGAALGRLAEVLASTSYSSEINFVRGGPVPHGANVVLFPLFAQELLDRWMLLLMFHIISTNLGIFTIAWGWFGACE